MYISGYSELAKTSTNFYRGHFVCENFNSKKAQLSSKLFMYIYVTSNKQLNFRH